MGLKYKCLTESIGWCHEHGTRYTARIFFLSLLVLNFLTHNSQPEGKCTFKTLAPNKQIHICSNCYKDSSQPPPPSRPNINKVQVKQTNKLIEKASGFCQVDKLQLLDADILLPCSLGPACGRAVGCQEERDKVKQLPSSSISLLSKSSIQ